VVAIDLASALKEAITGVQHMGNAVTMLVQWVFSIFNLQLPDYVARAVVILVSVVFLFKVGGKVSEVVLLIFIVLIIGTLLGIQLPWSMPTGFIPVKLLGV
jgi:hypothetical protein